LDLYNRSVQSPLGLCCTSLHIVLVFTSSSFLTKRHYVVLCLGDTLPVGLIIVLNVSVVVVIVIVDVLVVVLVLRRLRARSARFSITSILFFIKFTTTCIILIRQLHIMFSQNYQVVLSVKVKS